MTFLLEQHRFIKFLMLSILLSHFEQLTHVLMINYAYG